MEGTIFRYYNISDKLLSDLQIVDIKALDNPRGHLRPQKAQLDFANKSWKEPIFGTTTYVINFSLTSKYLTQ